jgi:hypothetical protein
MSQCRVVVVALAALIAVTACGRSQPKPTKAATMKDLVFLTRDGCVNTPDMMANMDDALSVLRLPHDMPVINIGTLPSGDPRTGYPTPTVLYKGVDLFGMPEPKPPYDVPS